MVSDTGWIRGSSFYVYLYLQLSSEDFKPEYTVFVKVEKLATALLQCEVVISLPSKNVTCLFKKKVFNATEK